MAEGSSSDDSSAIRGSLESLLPILIPKEQVEKWTSHLITYCLSVRKVESIFSLSLENDFRPLAQHIHNEADDDTVRLILEKLDSLKMASIENEDELQKMHKYQKKLDGTSSRLKEKVVKHLSDDGKRNLEKRKDTKVDPNAMIEFFMSHESEINKRAKQRPSKSKDDLRESGENSETPNSQTLAIGATGQTDPVLPTPRARAAKVQIKSGTEGTGFEHSSQQHSNQQRNVPPQSADTGEQENSQDGVHLISQVDGLDQILQALSLSERLHRSIDCQELIKIEKFTEVRTDRLNLSDLPRILLKQLFCYDGSIARGRYSIITRKISRESDSEDPENSVKLLNPIDVLLASYQCCDKEAQQVVCKILFACKLAFPLIYLNSANALVMSKWSLRDIIVQFRDERGRYVETSLISDNQIPVVSFVRIGELPGSKSKLLNSLLSESAHETFFHRDCTNGHARRICSNGLVEATVFLPSKTSGVRGLTQAFLAANLRGDLLDFDEQARILAEVSHVVVVFVDLKTLKGQPMCLERLRQLKDKTDIVLLVFKASSSTHSNEPQAFTEADTRLVESLPRVMAFIGKRNRPEREILNELGPVIVAQLMARTAKGENLFSIPLNFDEDKVVKGTSRDAEQLLAGILDADQASHHAECLPLTPYWEKYSQLLRAEYNQKIEKDVEESKNRRAEIRREQFQCLKNRDASIVALSFAKKLGAASECKDNGIVSRLYLQSIKLKLDENSRRVIPDLKEHQRHLMDKLHSKQRRESDEAKQELEVLLRKIRNFSIGLEHLLRELGQLFEAVHETATESPSELREVAYNLPKIFAKLLLWGVPLEILDGDAGNIPSSWISAILKSCQELVGDKKIYVISVLGLQSSGKSTLLNTMFGLKFAVSAGRCTRGAFLQLVPVESGAFPFDYIAVIDTEGLRAPELGLDKHHHDNELATLVIGLGDVTIINIKGENTAEMKDILQIAIHAFIRMKMANKNRDLHRHCIFIHQNVPAVGAKELMQEATSKMQQTLDAITKEAAEGEGLKDVKRFGDVLEFNRDSDIFFMSDLWQGDPPMAPVNPGYSADVQIIKQHLLHMLDKEQKSYLGFVDFSNRVSDLWKAILSEDFVFSFRNSIELKAYNILEKKFLEVMSEIEDCAEDWFRTAGSNSIRSSVSRDANSGEIIKMANSELRSLLVSKHRDCSAALAKFFVHNPYGDYMIHLKEKKLKSLEDSVRCLEISIRKRIIQLCEGLSAELDHGCEKSEWEAKIVETAGEIASQKRNLSDKELKNAFDSAWQQFEQKVHSESRSKSSCIEKDIIDHLRRTYATEDHLIVDILRKTPISEKPEKTIQASIEESIIPHFGQLLTASDRSKGKAQQIPERKRQRTVLVVEACSKLLEATLREIPGEGPVRKQEIAAIHKHVQTGCEKEINAKLLVENVAASVELEIRLAVLAFRHALPKLVEVDSSFYDRNGQRGRLAASKDQMWSLFRSTVQGRDESQIVSDYCLNQIKEAFTRSINARIGDLLRRTLVNDIGRTKQHLIVLMLSSMAEREQFNEIVKYVEDPYQSALDWLTEYSSIKIFDGRRGASLFFSTAQSLIDGLLTKAETAARQAARSSSPCSLTDWIASFCRDLAADAHIRAQDFHRISTYKSAAVQDVLTNFLRFLPKVKAQLIDEFSKRRDVTEIRCEERGLCAEILRRIWGCQEKCPFCQEPCSKSMAGHFDTDGTSHSCVQHRPQGVSGWRWVSTGEFIPQTCGSLLYQQDSNQSIFSCATCLKSTKPTEDCRRRQFRQDYFHPYSMYKLYFPDWDIAPDANNSRSSFWMWFVWRYRNELAAKNRVWMDLIPKSWSSISKAAAIDSLQGLVVP